MWSEREHRRDDVHDTEVLVLRTEAEAKSMLIGAHGGVLFSTPHYEGYRTILIRLADAEPDLLADMLEESYRLAAPASLVRELDG